MRQFRKEKYTMALPLLALLAGLGTLAGPHAALAKEMVKANEMARSQEKAANSTASTAKEMKVIQGKLAIKDQATRSFTVAGGHKSYIAPAGMDLASLAGKEVRVEVRSDGTVAKLSAAPPVAKSTTGTKHKATD